MGLNFGYLEGQTPLDADDKEGLLIPSITSRGELDEFEQMSIETAVSWLLKKKLSTENILSLKFIKKLHKMMFGTVWKWAGEFRNSNKNIGVDKYEIGIELKNFLDDCKYWIDNKTFSENEIAVRVSHRMVLIHPFANGNGRHSRLFADTLVHNGFGQPCFSWGRYNLVKPGEARAIYLRALRQADNQDYAELIKFARL